MISIHPAVATPEEQLSTAFTGILSEKLAEALDWSPIREALPDALAALPAMPDALKADREDDVMNCPKAASLMLRLVTAEQDQGAIPYDPESADYRAVEPIIARLASGEHDGRYGPLLTRDGASGAWTVTDDGLEAAMAFDERVYRAFITRMGGGVLAELQ